MIKKIPIKGISRDPSGQVSADGMCAESLNVQLDMGEVAPMMAPKPVTEYGDDLSVEGDILYIHKGVGLGYENLICLSGLNLFAYKSGGGTLPLYTYEAAPTIKSITHVGNTLIVSEGDNLRYFLYKDNEYHYLGTKIPVPAIWFGAQHTAFGSPREDVTATTPGRYPDREGEGTHFVYDAKVERVEYAVGSLDPDSWGTVATKFVLDDADAISIMDQLWGKVDENLDYYIKRGEAIFPIFVRYAVRLYDDTLYACSIPILLGGDIEKQIDVKLWAPTTGEHYMPEGGTHTSLYWDVYGCVGTPRPYKIMVDFSESQLATLYDGWGDIVKSIDFFISDQIIPAARRDAIQLTDRTLVQTGDDSTVWGYYQARANGVIDPATTGEELITAHSQTYLAKSIAITELTSRIGLEIWDDINLSADYILNQEALIESYLSNHQWLSDSLANYNNSMLMLRPSLRLGHGHPYLHSSKWITNVESGLTGYGFVFHLQVNGNEYDVASVAPDGEYSIDAKSSTESIYPYSTEYTEYPVAWLAYPDSRCTSVTVLKFIHGQARLWAIHPMKPLATQDVAYCFTGFGKTIGGILDSRATIRENNLVPNTNVLIQTKSSNPFITTPSGVVTMSGDILNIGTVTTPLSEGQAGQFHLYVFTTEGIFALSVNDEGVLMYSHSVSRELLLNKNSLVPIEQAIFFASARGLMLLQGSTVTKVSELMDGKPDSLSNELAQSIASRFFSGIPIEETAPFYQFLNGCKMAYDYANARIILYREGQSDMYVYKFNTQSWHRMAWNPLRTPVRTLNSYPEAFIVESDGLGHQIPMNYSTLAEDPEGLPLPGLVYTRELSLDEIDIYKTINRLKVRGRYADGHVKWALQGSNDGINYRTLHSLRGPSWKWYRIAVVTLLDAQERISYIELDYTPKFTNKIR